MSTPAVELLPELRAFTASVISELEGLPKERQEKLDGLASRITAAGSSPALVFICTHNSRRSHLCQLWATVADAYYGVGLHHYSGGTEVTALNLRVIRALTRAGFQITDPGGDNPNYQVKFSEAREPQICFSKVYDDAVNPSDNFIAVMTCDEADAACPIVPGATARYSLPYVDPKVSDDSAAESATYDERCRQIAVEMFHLLRKLSRLRG